MKARQFINVVMQRYRGDSGYTLSRIKAAEQLFYGSTEEARAAEKSRVNMDWPSSAMVPPWMDTVSRIPPPRLRLQRPKGSRPIGFSTIDAEAQDRERADVFYVMGRFPISCNPCNFEALMYSDPSNGGRLKGWHWHSLPSPPPAYVDNFPVVRHALLDMH
ncbi:hypothetical protein D1007_03748 [Hordeum vulgare]|nr:hypothetical protein D1007_03748 [Hordeum vulgare]